MGVLDIIASGLKAIFGGLGQERFIPDVQFPSEWQPWNWGPESVVAALGWGEITEGDSVKLARAQFIEATPGGAWALGRMHFRFCYGKVDRSGAGCIAAAYFGRLGDERIDRWYPGVPAAEAATLAHGFWSPHPEELFPDMGDDGLWRAFGYLLAKQVQPGRWYGRLVFPGTHRDFARHLQEVEALAITPGITDIPSLAYVGLNTLLGNAAAGADWVKAHGGDMTAPWPVYDLAGKRLDIEARAKAGADASIPGDGGHSGESKGYTYPPSLGGIRRDG